MESISAILVTLGIFKSLASNVQSNVVVKVIPDCSFALDTYQALDSNVSLLQAPHYFRSLLRAFWGLVKAMIRIYSQENSKSFDRIHNHRRGAASGLAVCKDSS